MNGLNAQQVKRLIERLLADCNDADADRHKETYNASKAFFIGRKSGIELAIMAMRNELIISLKENNLTD